MKNKTVEMVVESIRIHAVTAQRIIVLKEKDGKRSLFIWIGPNEAEAIFIGLKRLGLPRPLTHDLLLQALMKLGAKIVSITITDMAAETFFARIDLAVQKKAVELDARPSDAIALAVRAQIPIFVAKEVLNKTGVVEEEEAAGGKGSIGPFANILEALEVYEGGEDGENDDEEEELTG